MATPDPSSPAANRRIYVLSGVLGALSVAVFACVFLAGAAFNARSAQSTPTTAVPTTPPTTAAPTPAPPTTRPAEDIQREQQLRDEQAAVDRARAVAPALNALTKCVQQYGVG